ncbi:hypothetical protein ACFX2F_045292 [Malus domestica]
MGGVFGGAGFEINIEMTCELAWGYGIKRFISWNFENNRKSSSSSSAALAWKSQLRELLETIISNLPLENPQN